MGQGGQGDAGERALAGQETQTCNQPIMSAAAAPPEAAFRLGFDADRTMIR
jgi:hypothetical protein